jgi:hypothetical protein
MNFSVPSGGIYGSVRENWEQPGGIQNGGHRSGDNHGGLGAAVILSACSREQQWHMCSQLS